MFIIDPNKLLKLTPLPPKEDLLMWPEMTWTEDLWKQPDYTQFVHVFKIEDFIMPKLPDEGSQQTEEGRD